MSVNVYGKDKKLINVGGGYGDNIPVYTTEEYEQIKDTIPEGTKFIISDDVSEDFPMYKGTREEFDLVKNKLPVGSIFTTTDEFEDIIDDEAVSANKTLSSEKINNSLKEVNDKVVVDKAYSFSNNTGTNNNIHLGELSSGAINQAPITIEAYFTRADGNTKITLTKGMGDVYKESIGSTNYNDIYITKTSDYKYDVYIQLGSWSSVTVKVIQATGFTYDGTITEATGVKIGPREGKVIKLPATSGDKWMVKDFPDGHYMVVGNNNEYIGICYFSIKRWDSNSIECHYFGFGDDVFIEGENSEGKGFSKQITAVTQSVYFNENSTICFTGDSFYGAYSDTLYKLN